MTRIGNTIYLDGSEMNPFAAVLIAEELERLQAETAEIIVRGKHGPVKIVATKLTEGEAAKGLVVPNL